VGTALLGNGPRTSVPFFFNYENTNVTIRKKSSKKSVLRNMTLTPRQQIFLGLWEQGLPFIRIAKAMKVGIRQTFKWRQRLQLPNRPRGGQRDN
jgi:DNA-binding CsgD family transcriptional regulator